MITYNKQESVLEIKDQYKGRLLSSRIISLVILLLSIYKLVIADWEKPTEMDYVFILVTVVFVYIVYKNYIVLTALDRINKTDIKHVKMPKALGTKVSVKLISGKTREVFGFKTVDGKATFKKMLSDAKIKVI